MLPPTTTTTRTHTRACRLSSDSLFDDYERTQSHDLGSASGRASVFDEATPLLGADDRDGDTNYVTGVHHFATLFGVRQLVLMYVCVFALSAISLGFDLGVISVAKDKAGEDLGLNQDQVSE